MFRDLFPTTTKTKILGTDRYTMSFETLSGIRMVNDFVKSMKTDLHHLTIPRDAKIM